MWTEEQGRLFAKANQLNNARSFTQGLEVSRKLLALVEPVSVQAAYALGCRKAVAERHLGLTDAATDSFTIAYSMAIAAQAWAIAAYILNDWASMHPPGTATVMVDQAIALLEQAEQEEQGSPDPERVIEADRAYMEATRSRLVKDDGQSDTLAYSRRILARYAYGGYPRYKHAYLLVMLWELESSKLSILMIRGTIKASFEAIRQKKYKVAAGTVLLSITKR